MIPLEELKPYFDSLSEDESTKIDELYKLFCDDFINNPFLIDNRKVIVKTMNSKLRNYTQFSEGFVHLISRKSELKGQRIFDPERANRIHWVKQILLQKDDSKIKYFQYVEADRSIRDYYWYKEKNFLVILEEISKNYLLITSFIVDKENFKRIEKRYYVYLFKK